MVAARIPARGKYEASSFNRIGVVYRFGIGQLYAWLMLRTANQTAAASSPAPWFHPCPWRRHRV